MTTYRFPPRRAFSTIFESGANNPMSKLTTRVARVGEGEEEEEGVAEGKEEEEEEGAESLNGFNRDGGASKIWIFLTNGV